MQLINVIGITYEVGVLVTHLYYGETVISIEIPVKAGMASRVHVSALFFVHPNPFKWHEVFVCFSHAVTI